MQIKQREVLLWTAGEKAGSGLKRGLSPAHTPG